MSMFMFTLTSEWLQVVCEGAVGGDDLGRLVDWKSGLWTSQSQLALMDIRLIALVPRELENSPCRTGLRILRM